MDAKKIRVAPFVAWGGPFGEGPVAAWLESRGNSENLSESLSSLKPACWS